MIQVGGAHPTLLDEMRDQLSTGAGRPQQGLTCKAEMVTLLGDSRQGELLGPII